MDTAKIDNTKLEQYELTGEDLYWECNASCLGVESTEELEDSMRVIGQDIDCTAFCRGKREGEECTRRLVLCP